MTCESPIYLDCNATTPCAPEVVAAMLPFLESDFGNPSSLHVMGRKAAQAVAVARDAVAASIACESEEVLFTGGATESNNIILLGLAQRESTRNRIVLTAIEHKSVWEPCKWLAERGFDVAQIPVSSEGVADICAAEQLIDSHTLLVSIQGANNEIGTIQPVSEVAEIAHRRGALVHSDATQMLGKVPVSVDGLGVDFASFSGHKLYGPKGVGALFVRRRRAIRPVYRGGGQESDIRPGTLNVPAIVGLGEACRLAVTCVSNDVRRIVELRGVFERQFVRQRATAYVVGGEAKRLPGTSSICVPGVPADILISRLRGLCIGTGSACTSGAVSPSHVLLASGVSREDASCVIRVSIGRYTGEREVQLALEQINAEYDAIERDKAERTI